MHSILEDYNNKNNKNKGLILACYYYFKAIDMMLMYTVHSTHTHTKGREERDQ